MIYFVKNQFIRAYSKLKLLEEVQGFHNWNSLSSVVETFTLFFYLVIQTNIIIFLFLLLLPKKELWSLSFRHAYGLASKMKLLEIRKLLNGEGLSFYKWPIDFSIPMEQRLTNGSYLAAVFLTSIFIFSYDCWATLNFCGVSYS